MATGTLSRIWNASIRKLNRSGQRLEAFQLFKQMSEEGVIADKYTYICALTVCANLTDLALGKHVHVLVPEYEEKKTEVGNALVNMYGKCGNIEDAVCIFNGMPQHDLYSWSSVITVYAKQGYGTPALKSSNRMMEEGIPPNRITFISVLSACACSGALVEGKRAHTRFETCRPINDVILETTLVNLYGKCGKLEDALVVFDKMPSRDNIAWNAIISASIDQKQGMLAFEFFKRMHREGVTPDKVTFTSLIDACANHKVLLIGKQFHDYLVERGYELDIVLGTTLVNMYGRCASLEDACRVFDKMPFHNVVSWNALISGHAQNGLGAEAMHLLSSMQRSGLNADNITFISIFDACSTLEDGRHVHICIIYQGLELDSLIGNALVNMYGKCNRLDEAQYVFRGLPKCNVITWTSMIATYAQEGQCIDALKLFDRMREKKVQPDKVTFICGLTACTSQMALAEGKQMHQHILDSGIEIDIDLGNALITMYTKCGKLTTSQNLFEQMLNRDVISWNAVVTGFAQHGMGKEAVIFYQRLLDEGIMPTKVTFVGVLTACSHAGLVEQGQCFHISADEYKGITIDVDHQDCITDLLGRSGCFAEAEALVNEMPFQPSALSFLVLLGASKNLAEIECGERLANQIHELDPYDPSPYVILSNIYVDNGVDMDTSTVRALNLEDKEDHDLIRPNGYPLDFRLEGPSFVEDDKIFASL